MGLLLISMHPIGVAKTAHIHAQLGKFQTERKKKKCLGLFPL